MRRPAFDGAVAFTIGSAAVLSYVLVGYPLLAGLLARLRPRPVTTEPGFTPSVSLVIAALDEADAIDRKLANCLALDYPRELLEIVVVTDGSTDDTPEQAARHDGVVVLHDPVRRGKTAALTRGALASRGDVFVFTDANNLLLSSALRELVSPLADPSVGCVTGRKAIDDGSGRPLDAAESLYWRYEAAIRRWESRWGSVSSVNGELLALRREAFAHLSSGTVNDDVELAIEAAIAGWRIAYAERAISLEAASATTGGESTRRSRIVAGRWVALRRLGRRLARANPVLTWQVLSHKALRLVLPVAATGLALGNLASVRRRSWTLPLLVAQGAFYAAAAVGWRLDRRRVRNLVTYVPYYFVRMNVATAVGLARAVRHSPSSLARWQRVERG
jgi:cellulose synthase/poly-beta-1,6-N-acetylglucosamine synthase-like glycosyltransferase